MNVGISPNLQLWWSWDQDELIRLLGQKVNQRSRSQITFSKNTYWQKHANWLSPWKTI